MNITTLPPGQASTLISRRIRVMVVDDAVVVRGLFARWVEAETDLQVVATLRTGREAVEQVERADPDVVLLDIDMPDMDGLTALPLMLGKKRDLVVIMASTLTRRNAEISLKALTLGATDYIPKPETNQEVAASSNFRRELIEKVRALGSRAKRLRVMPATPVARPIPSVAPAPVANAPIAKAPVRVIAPSIVPDAAPPVSLRAFPAVPPRILAIGASTGGPQAITTIVSKLGGLIDRAPVLITQHMPPTFTTILAEHIGRVSGRAAHEAVDGEEVKAGKIYIAPGGKHMRIARNNGNPVIALDDGPMINFCKPAVDPMFSTAAETWGGWVCGVVLTGMGSDGLGGAQAITGAGGCVIAQDEASSVVWGMPGVVAQAGLCSAVLPVSEIAPRLMRLFAGERA